MIFVEYTEPRIIIAPAEESAAPLLRTTQADRWIAAKVAFGYPLTPLQRRILDGTASPFEISGQWTPGLTSRITFKRPAVEPLPDATAAFIASLQRDGVETP